MLGKSTGWAQGKFLNDMRRAMGRYSNKLAEHLIDEDQKGHTSNGSVWYVLTLLFKKRTRVAFEQHFDIDSVADRENRGETRKKDAD